MAEQGFEPATTRSRVQCFNHSATLSPSPPESRRCRWLGHVLLAYAALTAMPHQGNTPLGPRAGLHDNVPDRPSMALYIKTVTLPKARYSDHYVKIIMMSIEREIKEKGSQNPIPKYCFPALSFSIIFSLI